ncbi:hypothetical protein DN062_14640 [Nitrincola tibetensis]|uniref:Regulatory protein RecX n=1 Tax=Nitrincola tibetensis TaxID=2219697 RepID=A0A364NJ98_9GAMM|nr:regulatory protein RecX [Nitrincola tibetensis]RAU17142.1 hypothetical protein DN062_14640 [Nitrincola tibetensis]
MSSELNAQELRYKIISLLARREYSRAELSKRLQSQTSDIHLLNSVLDQLAEDGYQSDYRFTEMFIRNRLGQYYGEARIRYELRQKGIEEELVDSILGAFEPDWYELAKTLANKRFTLTENLPAKDYAKCMRYLLNHGFSYDQAREGLKSQVID